jgi:hypothetical protein
LHGERVKKYLAENPDKHTWRGATRNKSVPCETFKNKLKERNIEFIEEYQPLLHEGRFF